MNHHKLKVHSSEEDLRVACDECDTSYSTRAALNRHKSVGHLGLKEYQCEECPAKFARDGVLLDNQFDLLFYAHIIGKTTERKLALSLTAFTLYDFCILAHSLVTA